MMKHSTNCLTWVFSIRPKVYGISGTLLSWLQSYLIARKLLAVVTDRKSQVYDVLVGIPQGSILWPMLFPLYVKDFEDCLPEGVELAVYANDMTLYYCLSSKAKVAEHVVSSKVQLTVSFGGIMTGTLHLSR